MDRFACRHIAKQLTNSRVFVNELFWHEQATISCAAHLDGAIAHRLDVSELSDAQTTRPSGHDIWRNIIELENKN